MKKIGIFSGYYLPHLGGVERYVDKLSKGLRKLGYEVVIITSRHDDKFASHEQEGDLTIYRLPIYTLVKNRYPIPKINLEYKTLLHYIEEEEIDYFILNTRFHLTSLVGAKMSRRFNRPVMLIEHGTDHFTVNNSILDFIGKIYEHILTFFIKRYVHEFYGVSIKCNKWLEHFSIRAKGVFYNAVNVEDRNGVKDYYTGKYQDEVVISYAGRLIKEKGILNLLDAFTELKARHPTIKARMVIAGDGNLMDVIQSKYNDPLIELLGRLDFPHVMALYKRSDIFVYPSLYPEGLPTSILEAGLMECAVVATPKGGTEEVITDGQHGIIVDGSRESLMLAIEKLIKDPNYRTLLARNLKVRVETSFNWDVVAEKVHKEINELK
jgi:glycosyltransferase involved in cell wall biosynthesis